MAKGQGTWNINEKHGLRFLLAPLSYSENGQLGQAARFAGQSYSAEIKLTQDSTSSSDDAIGLVPLLYLGGEYRFDDHWSLSADLDGLAGDPGRAIDLGIRLNYTVNERWKVGMGYRTLEGGDHGVYLADLSLSLHCRQIMEAPCSSTRKSS